jgi:hypothetical protein
LLACAACFSESPSTTGDTGAPCPVGTNGCPCDAGACQDGLVCHGPSSNCYAPECTLGSLACPCAEGQCLGALACIDDFCQSPPGSDGTTTSMPTSMSMGSPSTGDEATTLPPPTTEGTTSLGDGTTLPDPVTTLLPETTADVITDDTLTMTGTEQDCIQCLMNAPQECTCDCVELAECYYAAGTTMACCSAFADQQAAWNTYVACATAELCDFACDPPPTCS